MALPDDPKPTKVDYTPLFLNGLSSEQISGTAKEKGVEVSMLPEDQAYSKYTGKGGIYEGLDQAKFHDYYSKAHDSYDKYQTNQFNGNIAPLWEYDKNLKGNIDLSTQPQRVPPGYDEFGRMIATPSEVAAKRGYIQDGDKQIPYKEPGFWGKLWAIPTGLLGEMVMPELSPLMQGDDMKKVVVLDQDKDGSPYYRTAAADDPNVLRSQILSAWGPQSLQENWFSAMLKGFYNGVVGIESMEGTFMEGAGKVVNFLATGKDDNNWLERRGRLYENLAQRSKLPVGVDASGSMFSSWSAASYAIGSLIPIVLMTRGAGGALEGAGMTEASAHGAANFSVFAGLGMDSYVGAARENGVDPADVFWQASLVGAGSGLAGMFAGPQFLAGKLANAEFKAGMTKMISKEMADEGAKFGADNFAKLTSEQKLNFVQKINNSIANFYKNGITDITTKTGKLVLGAHGMGRMMAGMEGAQVGVETLNDWRALLKNPNSAPGKGQFENYDTNKSFISNVWDRLPNRMLQAYVNGFVTGLVYTPLEAGLQKGFGTLTGKESPTIFSNMKPLSNENIVSMGKTEDGLKIYSDEHDKGSFGRTTHYDDGTPITGDKDPNKMTENDARYQAAVQDLQYTQEVANQFASPEIREAFGQNISIFRDVLKTGKELNELTEQLKAEPDNAKLLADYKDARGRMDYLTVKEEGTKFSGAYNDKIKGGKVSLWNTFYTADREWEDKIGKGEKITDEDRKSPEWQKIFNEKSKDESLKKAYQASREFSLEVDKEGEKRLADNTRITRIEKDLVPTEIPKISAEIKNTLTAKSDEEKIGGLRKITSMINEVADKIDMSQQRDLNKEFINLKGHLTTEAGQRGNEDADVGYKAGLQGALQGTETLFENKQNLISTDRNNVIHDLLSGDIERQVNGEDPLSISNIAYHGFPDPRATAVKIKELADKTKRNLNVAKSANFLNDPQLKQHVTKSDIVLPEDLANEHFIRLSKLDAQLDNYAKQNDKITDNISDRYFAQHIEKTKRALENLTPVFISAVPDFANILKTIPDIPPEWHEIDYPLSDADRKKLNEYNKILTDLKSKIFDNRKEIMATLPDKINELVEIRNPQTVADTYLGGQYYNNDEYKTSLDALYQIKGGADLDPFLKAKGGVDLGYIQTVNTLIECLGVHAGSLELARLKAYTQEGAEMSDPHMQQAENIAYAFMVNDGGNAHEVLKQVLDAEVKALKGKVSESELANVQRQYIKNAIFVGGDSATGKSTRFLKALYDLHRNTEGFNKTVSVLGVTKRNNSVLEKSLGGVNATYYTLDEVLNDPYKITDIKNFHHIIIDEGQRLTEENLQLLKDHFTGSNSIVFLGDTRQTDKDFISHSGVKTMPFTERKMTVNPLVGVLHDFFRGIGQGLPNGFVDENGDGVQYFKTKEDVISAFQGDKSEDKALIVDDYEGELQPNIFRLDRNLKDTELPESIRGSQFKKVYIAIDRNISDYYTATGRATNYIGLFDTRADELNKTRKEDVSWITTSTVEPQTVASLSRELERLYAVTGQQKPVVTEDPEKEKTDPQEILPLKFDPVVGDVVKVRNPDKQKDGLYAKITSVDGGVIKGFQGKENEFGNKEKTFDLLDLGYRDPNHQEQYEPKTTPAPTIDQLNAEQTFNFKGGWGTSHTVLGTKVSPEDKATKRDLTPIIHTFDGNELENELVWRKTSQVNDIKDNDVEMPNMLWVRFSLKPETDVNAFADKLAKKAGSKLPAKALDEIKKSLSETGQLPDKYRYLFSLGKPDLANPQQGRSEYNKLIELISFGKASGKDEIVLAKNLHILGPDQYKANAYQNDINGKPFPAIPLRDFIEKYKDKVNFDDNVNAESKDEKGRTRQKKVLFYSFGGSFSGDNSYAIIRTNKINEIVKRDGLKGASDVISSWKADDNFLKYRKKGKDQASSSERTNQQYADGTYLMDFFRNNKANIKKNAGAWKVLDKWGKWNGREYKLKDYSYSGYESMYDDVIKNASLFGDNELPFGRYDSLKQLLDSGDADNFVVQGEIHSPYTYVDIRNIKPGAEPAKQSEIKGLAETYRLMEQIQAEKGKPTVKESLTTETTPDRGGEKTQVAEPQQKPENAVPEQVQIPAIDPLKGVTEDNPALQQKFMADVEAKPLFTIDVNGEQWTVSDVNGEKVKTDWHNDFTQGGNNLAGNKGQYKYTPPNNLIVDRVLTPVDKNATIVHEAVEYDAEKNDGKDYGTAHEDVAQPTEIQYREEVKTNPNLTAKEFLDNYFGQKYGEKNAPEQLVKEDVFPLTEEQAKEPEPIPDVVTPQEVQLKAREANTSDVPLVEQKKDLLQQIGNAIDLIKNGRTGNLVDYVDVETPEKLRQAGFTVREVDQKTYDVYNQKENLTGNKVWQVVFDVEGDGTFALKLDTLDESAKVVQKEFPTKDISKETPPPTLPNHKYYSEVQELTDNYWEAVRVGNTKLADVWRKTLADNGYLTPPAKESIKGTPTPMEGGNPTIATDKYYTYTKRGIEGDVKGGFEEILGNKVELSTPGDFFSAKFGKNNVRIYEGKTGVFFAEGKNEKQAIDDANKKIAEKGGKLNESIINRLREHGLSPRYKLSSAEQKQAVDDKKIAESSVNKWFNDNTPEGIIPDGAKGYFGNLINGKIKEEMGKKGILGITPKSEFFYMALNKMSKKETAILGDVKIAMKRHDEEWRDRGDILDEWAYDWLSNNLDSPDKWITPKNTFKKFAEKVSDFYSKYQAEKNLIDGLINYTNGGRLESRQLFMEGDNKPYQEFSDEVALSVEKKAIDYFGTTDSLRSAGYLTISGNLLDLSGAKYGSMSSGREQDHREINSVLEGVDLGKYETDSQWQGTSSGGMLAFMDMGNIRVMPESGGIDMNKMPTQEQFTELRRIISKKNGEIILDLNNYTGGGVSKEYDKWTPTDNIIQDIKNWYNEGTNPKTEIEQWDSRKLQEVQNKRLTQKKFEILLDKIQSQFPQINFVQENDESLKDKGVNPSLKGYDDAEGTHYNIDRVTTDTPIHELQHIWNKVFKARFPEEYAKIENEVKDAIASKGSYISMISDKVKAKYPELNNSQHIDEVMSTIGGLRSIEAVERFLSESDIKIPPEDKNFVQRLYDGVKDFVTRLWDGIKSALGLNIEVSPNLDKFYKDFTDQIFNGKTFHFSPDEMKIINNIGGEQRDNRIFGLSDIVRTLAPEHNDSLRYSHMDEESLTDLIFKTVKDKGQDEQGNYIYMSPTKGIEYERLKSTTDEDLKKEIQKKIVPRYQILDTKISDACKNWIEYLNSPLALEDSRNGKAKTAYDLFGDTVGKKYSFPVVNELVNLTGIGHGALDVLRYDELPNHSNPIVRGLFKDGMEGYNPIVIIHGYKDGKPDISLLDITSYGQGEEAVPGNRHNIFGSLMDDKAYRKAGGPTGWNDRLYSNRKLLLGMQALGMDATFRRLSVIQILPNKIKPYQITNIDDVNKLLDVLKGQREFMANVGDNTIKGLIENKRADVKIFGTPWMEQLQNYLTFAKETTSDYLDYDENAKGLLTKYNAFLDPDATPDDLKNGLTAWQRDLDKEITDPTMRFNDPIYQLISANLNALKHPYWGGVLNRAEEIDVKKINFTSPIAGIQSNFVQAQFLAMEKSIAMTIRKYSEYHDKVKDLLSDVSNDWQKSHLPTFLKSLVSDIGNEILDHTYKKVDAIAAKDLVYEGKRYAKGDHVQVRSNLLIQEGDPEAKDLTPAELQLNKVMLEQFRERGIDNIYWDHMLNDGDSIHDDMGNPTYTREMAEKQFDDMYSRGMSGHVPISDLSASNLIMKGKLGQGVEKWKQNVTRPEEQFADMIGDEGLKKLFGSFNQQMKDPVAVYEKMGLSLVDDGATSHLELFDPEANLGFSHNTERTGEYFILKGARDEMIGREFIPEHNTQEALLAAYKIATGAGLSNTVKIIGEYVNRYVNRENADKDANFSSIELPGGQKIEINTAARVTMAALKGITLAGKPIVATKVTISGMFNSMIRAAANSMAELGIPKEQADKLFPGLPDWMTAFGLMFTHPRLIFNIADKFKYINANEASLTQYPSQNISTRKDIMKRGLNMISEQWADMTLRVHALISMMVHNGAWKAYSLDKNGLVWNRLKDKRYFNPDGSQTPEQKAMYDALVKRMRETEEMKPTDKYPDRGDDDYMINNQYKWYSNQFVYPSIDDASRGLMGNRWWGQMVSMFKNFWFPRLQNMGMGGRGFDSVAGGSIVPHLDKATNEWVADVELRHQEGQFQSLRKALNNLMAAKSFTPEEFAKWWKGQDPRVRQNLMASVLYTGALSALIYWITPNMSKRDQKRFSYYYADMMLGTSGIEWLKNPVPMISTTLKVAEIAMGQKNFNTMTQSVGFVSGIRRVKGSITSP